MEIYTSASEILSTMIQEDQFDYPSHATMNFVDFLLRHGCDYFDIMRVMTCEGLENCSPDAVEYICSHAPDSRKLKSLGLNDIHGMIARWTATKFHTGPIENVLRDIQNKCLLKQTGLYIYNSNLNVHNPRAANDPYLLVITDKEICFLDLNRKISYKYMYESGDIKNA